MGTYKFVTHIAFYVLLCLTIPQQAFTEEVIHLPKSKHKFAPNDFQLKILQLALEHGKPRPSQNITLTYRNLISEEQDSSDRRTAMLLIGKYDIIWSVIREPLEEQALRVNIPLLRGLMGYRLFLIPETDQPKFDSIASITELQKLKAGLGNGWKDIDVFKANKLPFITGPNHPAMWRMLTAGRFDYYPRGLNEIIPELNANQEAFTNIVLEKNLLVYYPLPVFFYVNAERPALHKQMTDGLHHLIETGRYREEWEKAYLPMLKQADLENRKAITLETPFKHYLPSIDHSDLMLSPKELIALSQ